MVSFFEAFKICFCTKILKFNSRASRAEFWWLIAFYIAFLFFASWVPNVYDDPYAYGLPPKALVLIACIMIPVTLWTVLAYVSVIIRRMHDVNWSATTFVSILLAFVGLFALAPLVSPLFGIDSEQTFFVLKAAFVMFLVVIHLTLVFQGTKGDNRFGPDPLKRGNYVLYH